MISTKQRSSMDTWKIMEKESKYTLKKITKSQDKREREEQRGTIKIARTQHSGKKYILISN